MDAQKTISYPLTSKDNLDFEIPISIILTKSKEPTVTSNADVTHDSKLPTNPPERSDSAQPEEPSINVPIFEIVDSSDEAPIEQPTTANSGNETFLSRSSQNLGPPKIHSKRHYIDFIQQFDKTSGSASNPINLDPTSSNESPLTLAQKTLQITWPYCLTIL